MAAGAQGNPVSFCPSVYEHAARLIDRTPWEVSRDATLTAAGHIEAYRRYRHRPVVVGIDIYNLEAEAYGAVVEHPADAGIPAISRPLCPDADDVLDLDPFNPRIAGRVPLLLEAARQVASACPDADVRVPVAGPFSIAVNLVGFESLLPAIALRPDRVREALCHLAAGQARLCQEVVRHGLDVAFFESSATPPMMSPAQFRRVELPALTSVLTAAAEIIGRPVPCIIGGDTEPILDMMLATGTGYVVCPFATNQRAFMEKMRAAPEVMVRINMDLRVLLAKNREAIENEVDRVLGLVHNRPHVCLGTGALPYEADPEVVLWTRDLISSRSVGWNS
jgi:uroporphyrinogen decarboxylase